MPGKSRQRKGKSNARARKNRVQSQSGVVNSAVAPVQENVSPAAAPSSPAAPSQPRSSRATALESAPLVILEHPFFARELKTIGLLSIGIVIVLFVLSFVLR